MLKMYFPKILEGIQSGNAGDLDTARPYISKFCASGKDPTLFSCIGQGTSREAGESGWVT